MFVLSRIWLGSCAMLAKVLSELHRCECPKSLICSSSMSEDYCCPTESCIRYTLEYIESFRQNPICNFM